MLHLDAMDNMYIDEKLSGFTKKLVQDGVCEKQVDLLLLGFGHAVRSRIPPAEKIDRHDLLKAGALKDDLRLATEAVAVWYVRELGQDPLDDGKKLLDFICRLGSAGLTALKAEWEGKGKSQIELAILRMSPDNRRHAATAER